MPGENANIFPATYSFKPLKGATHMKLEFLLEPFNTFDTLDAPHFLPAGCAWSCFGHTIFPEIDREL